MRSLHAMLHDEITINNVDRLVVMSCLPVLYLTA